MTKVKASLRRMRVNPVLDIVGRNPVTFVQDRARALRDEGRTLLDFSIGDAREPTSPHIPQVLRDAVPDVSRYPTVAGLSALRRAVAGYVRRRFGLEIDPDTEVTPVSGAKEAIFSTPLAFIDRGAADGVAWPVPGYPVYERGALFAGAVPFPTPLRDDFVFRASDMSDEVWRRVRLLWICSPHNPTGSVIPRGELARIRERAAAEDVLLCSDECYSDIYEDEAPTSLLEVGGVEGVLVYMSLSKRSGMTGYRSGAVVGDRRAISALRKLRSCTGTSSPEFVQTAAASAWADDGHAAMMRELILGKRRVLGRGFAEMGWPVSASEAGLYMWVKVPDDAAVTERLMDEGMAVTPGSAFGPRGAGYIRLALVPTFEECEEAVEVLKKCLNDF